MSLPSRLLGANPSVQVSSLLTGSIATPSASSSFNNGKYESIASTLLSTSTGTINFSSIPSNYQYLELRGLCRFDNNGISQLFGIRFNDDSGNNYDYQILRGEAHIGSVTGAGSTNQSYVPYPHATAATATSGMFGVFILRIFDYADTNKYTNMITLSGFPTNDPSQEQQLHITGSVWKNTSAVTKVSMICISGQLAVANTRASLYGIRSS